MRLNSKKELRLQRIQQALRSNLKKRKVFQKKIKRQNKIK
tara:strand:+ start:10588 stop:10707 length:120 start_codon:yes stop_codon:yes gene_type:complete